MNDDEIRVDDLWFTDDTLVIKAEQKIFRVSKSILAARSSVFADMVAFPQLAGGDTPLIDGKPVVTLYDRGMNVEVFLRAIFDSSFFMPPPAAVELDTVLGILRLAHKYDVQYLYRRALHHLSVRYGISSVEQYRNLATNDHFIYDCGSPAPLRYLSIIRAVTEVGALWLLPVLYYKASDSPRDTLRALIALGAEEKHVETCIAAQVDLVRATAKVWSFLSLTEFDGCEAAMECRPAKQPMAGWFLGTFGGYSNLTPLDDWPEEYGWDPISAKLCDACVADAQRNHQDLVQEVWEELPSMFDLPSWEELDAMRTAVLGTAES